MQNPTPGHSNAPVEREQWRHTGQAAQYVIGDRMREASFSGLKHFYAIAVNRYGGARGLKWGTSFSRRKLLQTIRLPLLGAEYPSWHGLARFCWILPPVSERPAILTETWHATQVFTRGQLQGFTCLKGQVSHGTCCKSARGSVRMPTGWVMRLPERFTCSRATSSFASASEEFTKNPPASKKPRRWPAM